MMELKDTTTMMVSDDYKERFKAEYYQLKIRIKKLSKMVSNWDFGELTFKPTCPRSTYELQLRAMNYYLAILEARAVMKGIDLEREDI